MAAFWTLSSASVIPHLRTCTCGRCDDVYWTPIWTDLKPKIEKLSLSDMRARAIRCLRENIRFGLRAKVLPRPQLPVGFHPLAPLARNNC